MALTEVLAMFTMDVSGILKAGKVADSAIGQMTGQLKKLGGMLLGGQVLSGLSNMVTELIDQGSALNDTSAQLGINTDALQGWQFAGKKVGVEAGEMNKSLQVLQKNMATAAANGARTGGPFTALGVQLRDAKGNMRETTDVLTDTGLAIARLKSPAERTKAAMEIFGKAGAKLNPLFAEGEAGLKGYLAEVKKLGGGFSADSIAKFDKMGDAMDDLDMAWTSAKTTIVSAFLPALTEMVGGLTGALAAITSTEEGSDMLNAGIVALGVAGAAAGLAFIAPWLPLIATFTFLGLLVQDFIVGLNGGKSLIGEVLDKLFGKGAGKTFFDAANQDLKAMVQWLKEAFEWVKKLMNSNNRSRMLRSLTGTETAADKQDTKDEEELASKDITPERKRELEDQMLTRQAQLEIEKRDRETGEGQNGRIPIRSWDERANTELFGMNMGDVAKGSMRDQSLIAKFKDAMREGKDTSGIPVNRIQEAMASMGAAVAVPNAVAGGGDSTMNANTTIQITTSSDDPEEIGTATEGAMGRALRAAHDAARRK